MLLCRPVAPIAAGPPVWRRAARCRPSKPGPDRIVLNSTPLPPCCLRRTGDERHEVSPVATAATAGLRRPRRGAFGDRPPDLSGVAGGPVAPRGRASLLPRSRRPRQPLASSLPSAGNQRPQSPVQKDAGDEGARRSGGDRPAATGRAAAGGRPGDAPAHPPAAGELPRVKQRTGGPGSWSWWCCAAPPPLQQRRCCSAHRHVPSPAPCSPPIFLGPGGLPPALPQVPCAMGQAGFALLARQLPGASFRAGAAPPRRRGGGRRGRRRAARARSRQEGPVQAPPARARLAALLLIAYIAVGHFVAFATRDPFLLRLLTQVNVWVGPFFVLSGYVAGYTATELGKYEASPRVKPRGRLHSGARGGLLPALWPSSRCGGGVGGWCGAQGRGGGLAGAAAAHHRCCCWAPGASASLSPSHVPPPHRRWPAIPLPRRSCSAPCLRC